MPVSSFLTSFSIILSLALAGAALANPSEEQLARWLKQFPKADSNGDGVLTIEEAATYRARVQSGGRQGRRGPPRSFEVHPGWQEDKFPEDAVCYQSPARIKEIYAKVLGPGRSPLTSFPKPADGALRIVGTGHSFMAPGYRVLPKICEAAGLRQPLHLHLGGGMTGSARFKWEQENGIFQFEGKPHPKLLASIANAQWEAMMWGPYFLDRPEYYRCWIEFCLKYNPEMKFYLSDAWPQVEQLDEIPESEEELTATIITRMGREKHEAYCRIAGILNEDFPDKVFILPTCDAMVLAAQYYHRGELPGVEGINRAIGGKKRSLWSDRLGHLGPGLDRLEGYVFYATLYRRSPELISDRIAFGGSGDFPGVELDRVFREIAWKAVVSHPLSGVRDDDEDGRADDAP